MTTLAVAKSHTPFNPAKSRRAGWAPSSVFFLSLAAQLEDTEQDKPRGDDPAQNDREQLSAEKVSAEAQHEKSGPDT